MVDYSNLWADTLADAVGAAFRAGVSAEEFAAELRVAWRIENERKAQQDDEVFRDD